MVMNLNPPPNPPVFPVRSQVTAALQRAAERARVIAQQTGTKLVVAVPPQTPITTGTAPTSEFLDDFGMDARVTGPALAQKMLDEKCLFRTSGVRKQL